mmetsp:Transcript_3849/g.7212  ORF Transcript_3849/g.7212 Transcript_3849/m.7212 type:complete len:125 (-) Transcript_3849:191-565(-)
MEEHVAPFMIVCSDITGPAHEAACGGKYLVHLTCSSTKWSWAKFLTKKIDLVDAFKGFSAWVSSLGYKISVVKTDAESVYVHGSLSRHCSDRGIKVSPSAPYLKEMNGKAENTLGLLWIWQGPC